MNFGWYFSLNLFEYLLSFTAIDFHEIVM